MHHPMNTLCLIPARGGSKRIPRKNIKDFCGKPMIAWAIQAAQAAGVFEHIVVSTDDSEVAETAKRWGAEAPFVRPAELCDDHTSTDSVVLHAVQQVQRLYGLPPYGCCVYPTTPFLTAEDLGRGFHVLKEHGAASALPVVSYDFPIEQAFLLDGARLRARWPDKLDARSQDLVEHYHDAGMFYWFDVPRFLAEPRLFGDDTVGFVLPSTRCHDINTPGDWEQAEIKLRILEARRQEQR